MSDISSCRHAYVTTFGLPPDDQFTFWRSNLVKRYEPLGPHGMIGRKFTATVRKLIAPEGEFCDLNMSAVGITRTRRLIQADGIDNIVLSLTLAGGGAGWFRGPDETTTLGGPRMRIRHQGSPYAFHWTGEVNHTLHLELPSASLAPRVIDRALAAAGTFLPVHGLVPMLAAQMRSLADAAPDLDTAARAAGFKATLDLAATILRLEFGAEAAESEVCEDGILIAAQALISRQYQSADLRPDTICHRLGCSRAHLYRVFARHDLTIAGYLREVRLRHARERLAAAGPRETIGDIAFRCGFEDAVHFTRLFRQRFGVTPGAFRSGGARQAA
jgi:AraC family transcriptional regulator, positive regulator of tynA and feaB